MKLFTVGPVMMFQENLVNAGKQLPYFRTSEFSEVSLDSERLLKKFVNSGPNSKVVFLTASGTGAMDAAVLSTFTHKDKLLVINGGGFGKRFEEICSVYGIPCDTLCLKFGETLDFEKLKPYQNKGYSGLLVNLDETSTGQLYSLELLSTFCRTEEMVFVVDAISAFLADPIDFDRYGIDILITSSQKALSLAPGISIMILSDKVYSERISINPPKSYYFDLNRYVTDQKRGQTPFTPAVGILLDLNVRLHMVDKTGVNFEINRVKGLAEYFRARAQDIGLNIPSYPLSNAVTPVFFENGGAKKIFEQLRSEYDLTVTPSGGELSDKLLRVGHLGNLIVDDYDLLISAFKEILL